MCGILFIKNTICCEEYINYKFYNNNSRGPDKSRSLTPRDMYIGFHRLAINGLDDRGMQPFLKHNCYLICNGEIYNHKKLYTYLNITPNSQSDCEIILDLYQTYGIEYTCKILDGVFAFVLIDLSNELIFYARDPFGVRPLYYYINNVTKQTGAASELKTLYHFNKRIDHFPPGSYSVYNKDSFTIHKYFILSATNIIYNNLLQDYDSYRNLIQLNLVEAVRKRLMTERPIACLLSGGLDSSLITSIVTKLLPNRAVFTFSIGMQGSTDLKYAKEVADYLGTTHHEIILTEDNFFKAIPDVIKIIESYDTTTVRASVGNYLICKYISKTCDSKVIFNGDGSDELTGGYLYFHNSPTDIHADMETTRLLTDISYFDVLRSDKSISSCGLESRTPFLDKSFVSFYKSLPLNIRFQEREIEKKILRDSFVGFLPENVLYRKKEAFSDGVSSTERSWFKVIQEKLENMNIPPMVNLTHNLPATKEQQYYRYIFEKHYPNQAHLVPYFWMPKWSDTNDPSARTLV